ncbi:MAG TPA: transcription elongation factor Spt5 [Nitrososphaera sp.]|nr:transcription elongation factor Spt5 [Nitrososphaera sp.]
MSDRLDDADDDMSIEDIRFDDDDDNQDKEVEGQQPPEQIVEMPRNEEEQKLEATSATEVDSTTQHASPPQPSSSTPASDSKFFAIRTTGGQERVVAGQIQVRVNAKKIGIRSVMVLDSFKGYIIIEAPDSNVAYEALAGIRHVRGQIRGDLPFKDIEGYLVKKPVVSELNIEDMVEVIAGPFKSMKAKITRVDYDKQEATVILLDSPYQIPVTVDANYLKKISH